MGCTASADGKSHAKKKLNIRNFKLKHTGVWSIDRFADQVEEVIERMARLTDDIDRKRATLEHLTHFDYYKSHGIKIRHIVYGILLQLFSIADGDLSKVKIDFKDKKPFIKISLHGITAEGADKLIEALEDYINEIVECMEEKMPRIISEMAELGPKAVQVQQDAQGEIDAKEGMDKLKAVQSVVTLVGECRKDVPEAMQKCLKEVQDEVNEVKELQAALQQPGELELIATDGKKCH